jgi:hypothetical protein
MERRQTRSSWHVLVSLRCPFDSPDAITTHGRHSVVVYCGTRSGTKTMTDVTATLLWIAVQLTGGTIARFPASASADPISRNNRRRDE